MTALLITLTAACGGSGGSLLARWTAHQTTGRLYARGRAAGRSTTRT